MEPYRLAKKWRGGDVTERRVLRAIADVCSMRDLECRKNPATIQKEYDIGRSSFKYGLQGRKRRNGSEYYPGLLKRGVVFIKQQVSGCTTVYALNLEVLRALVGESAEPEPVHKPVHNENGDLSTNEAEPVHPVDTTCPQNGGNLSTQWTPIEVPEVPVGAPRGTKTQSSNASSLYVASPRSPGSARGSAEKQTPTPLANARSGQKEPETDDALEDFFARVKKIAPRARFSEKNRAQFGRLLPTLNREASVDCIEHAVKKTVESCSDEKGWAFFGTTLANNILSDVRAYKSTAWVTRLEAFVEDDDLCESLDDLEKWLALNPLGSQIAPLTHRCVQSALKERLSLLEEYESLKDETGDTQ